MNGFTVALLVAVSLGITQLVLRLPAAAARQVPVTALVVLTAVSSGEAALSIASGREHPHRSRRRASASLCCCRRRGWSTRRQTLDRLASGLADVLESMGKGLQQPWSTDQTEEWRRTARTVRDRLVEQAEEAIGNSREVAQWNVRDRRHVAELGRYEDVLPRLERAAIGVSVISRGLDDHAHISQTTHRAMPAMGELLMALARTVRAVVDNVLGDASDADLAASFDDVGAWRARCAQGATRRARLALEDHEESDGTLEVEWLGYAALLVQVDRIIGDLSAPLPP